MTQRKSWAPDSWQSAPTAYQPRWPDPVLSAKILGSLRKLPALLPDEEADGLRELLGEVAHGMRLVLHAGECAERFEAVSLTDVRARLALLGGLADTLNADRQLSAVVIGRIAGQFAKPRSAPTRLIVGSQQLTEVASYMGDMVNGPAPDVISRRLDPLRLAEAYHCAAATLSLMRALSVPTARPPLPSTGIFTSHEALILGYEQVLSRRHQRTGEWYNCGAHLLWCGYRTCAAGGGHIEYLSGIGNPVGLKVGPGLSPQALRDICDRLDPFRIPGRLVLISRMGRKDIASRLEGLISAVRTGGHPSVWLCDPMHGNTFTLPDGRKSRHVDDLLEEIASFAAATADQGVAAGGLHLEVSADDVTECVGGPCGPSVRGLSRRYLASCDPRLNPEQARFVVEWAAQLFTPREATR
ncbi:phospho-2-dehydro-3-deoxyheptonate aldolase [Streptomyces spectabilis]|uniref:Phospho-2-dehydro-3-deoxyheptonate aldolase n=2 Tax=Streptomyces spectabilis TaxID=68270 RepID=A0A7W8B3N9_STRST|nr:3-deoxy-7-phosphoheptulonate synthase [Streptomyces spectabilis]MBB5109756.1 3-deoxy-7-phosphoheptulonate synthase [Streptomyces spectabilis]GGV55423.1 phospho-2-dehydro-3-deoxyheptonate aldolase [Streptomyces spectabilis]